MYHTSKVNGIENIDVKRNKNDPKLFYFLNLTKKDYLKLGIPEPLANAIVIKLKEI